MGSRKGKICLLAVAEKTEENFTEMKASLFKVKKPTKYPTK